MQVSFPPIEVLEAPSDYPAPPGAGGMLFDDIDEQAASLGGWNQRYIQLSAGVFRGGVQRLLVGGIGLFIEDLQQTVHQTGMVRPDVVALGIPLHFSGESRFCGQTGSAAELHVFSGANGFEFHSPKRHVMQGFEIDRPVFDAMFAADDTVPATAIGLSAGLHTVEQAAADQLRALGVVLFKWAAHRSGASGSVVEGRRAHEALVEKLVTVLDEPLRALGQPSRPAQHLQAQTLELRARDRVLAQLDQPPTVAELCHALGVSRRTLQNCIQATWGMGPLAWINTLRLNAVRSRLKTATSVTEAATEFCFWHFGHFSADYRALFGEPPSATLGRHRCRLAS
ncbi:MAG: helix-turn-helix domain-containing protein [Comamonadaceae bacterium]|nr:helix-turn-helix domain-containing protein [Comamonadaceae bacterium]